jgi:hypothetical protein
VGQRKGPELQSLSDVVLGHPVAVGEIGDGAGDPEHAVDGAGG